MSPADELRALGHRLLELAEQEEPPDAPSEGNTVIKEAQPAGSDPIYLLRLAEAILRARRLRDRHFDADLFADPAWDLLLDLYVQRAAGRRVSVTAACIGSGVPNTTALRWIAILETRRLLEKRDDDRDGRRAFVGLTPRGELAVADYLSAAGRYLRASQPVPFMLVHSKAS